MCDGGENVLLQPKISSHNRDKNAIADYLSRLTIKISEAEHFPLSDPILADYAVVKKIAYKDNIETDDPWVEKIASAGMLDTDVIFELSLTALDPEIPKESAVCNDGETTDLPNFADKREQPVTTRAPLTRST